MNLEAIANALISAVNPNEFAQWIRSDGFTTAADGSRAPKYLPPLQARVQRQPLGYQDLGQLSGLNVQGEKCSLHVTVDARGVDRGAIQGGDYFVIGANAWLVVQVLENWQPTGWSRVACVRQVNVQGTAQDWWK